MTKKAAAPSAAVVIHDLSQAVAALEAAAALARPIALWSASGAGIYAGAGWFAAMERRARASVPGAKADFILDCAERADLTQEAFRAGIKQVCFTGPARVAERLADIAGKWRAKLHRRRPNALDLLDEADPAAALRQYLAGD
jgi:hypothetical protein